MGSADELDTSACVAWAFPVAELNPRSEWEMVGEGSFGNVYRASMLGRDVAVKENESSKQNRLDGIHRDIAYLRRVQGLGGLAAWRATLSDDVRLQAAPYAPSPPPAARTRTRTSCRCWAPSRAAPKSAWCWVRGPAQRAPPPGGALPLTRSLCVRWRRVRRPQPAREARGEQGTAGLQPSGRAIEPESSPLLWAAGGLGGRPR